jgi:protein gp37
MGDLFGDWVPWEWYPPIFEAVLWNPQHTFQFLTKNPKRLSTELFPGFTWPSNCWVGTTVTNQADADERLPWLLQVDARVTFVSHEPLLSEIDVTPWLPAETRHGSPGAPAQPQRERSISWCIIGSMTGPGAVKPKVEWVMDLAQQYLDAGVPLFLKDNLQWPTKIQEFPA